MSISRFSRLKGGGKKGKTLILFRLKLLPIYNIIFSRIFKYHINDYNLYCR